MAASSPMDKVKDKEYSNWMKVTLALYYMKSGLHSFIQNEIACLHQSLLQKIYGGQTVLLPPCTICDAKGVKRNKFTGIWAFQKRCRSYCDVWLDELLMLHTNPTSEKIYWNNSHVPSWPFKPWECAKVFMPRGQPSSNAGPADCDAQALLILIANCTYFHRKLSPQSHGLTHKISTIRNDVIHNGEMKVSDADKMSFIQQIIQLLEDPVCLMSVKDCKAAVDTIRKIDSDSMDVFFNVDREMTALRAAVEDARKELGLYQTKTTDTVVSLQEEYKQLREEIIKRHEDFEKELKLHESRIDSVEKYVQQQEKKQQEMHSAVTHLSSQATLHEERFDTLEGTVQSFGTQFQQFDMTKEQTHNVLQQQQKLSESMETLSASVATHGVRLDTVEENMPCLCTKLNKFETVNEQKHNMLRQQETLSELNQTMSASITTYGLRLDAAEENVAKLQEEIGPRTGEIIYCRKENSTRKRPESDGLRQRKSQTEDELDTLKRLGFIQTKQMEVAKKLLQDKRSIVIQGNPGEGKTTTAFHLIDNEWCIDRRVLVKSPGDWKMVDTQWVDIVILEDIFGQFYLDQSRLQEWLSYLPTIQAHVDAGKLQVIITTRVEILAMAYPNLGSINIFCDEFSLTLSSDKLQESEKMCILNRALQRHNRTMQDNKKKECIINFNGLIGFPQCCLLFAGDNNLFIKGPDFFKHPEKLFSVNINRLEDHRFLSLAFLFCVGPILEKYLSPEALPEREKIILEELSSHLCIPNEKASVTLLRESCNNFSGLYVKKCDFYISISHNTVWEAVGLVLGERSPEMVVKYCDHEYLNQRTYAAEAKDRTSPNVFIPVSAYGHLAERIILDGLFGCLIYSRLDIHSAFKQHQFLIELKDQLRKSDSIDDFFCAKKHLIHTQNVSEGECVTFLQLLLQSDRNTADVVYDQFQEFLICSHNIDGFDTECRKCNEKKCLLELALYYNQLDIADKLITMNACISPISLCNAVRHGNLNRVKTILDSLKRDGTLDPQNKYVRKSLCRAFMSGNPSLVELLLKGGIVLDSSHVICVVKQGDIDALVKFVEYLKHINDWNPLYEKGNQGDLWEFQIRDICPSLQKELQFSRALCFAYREEKLDIVEFLLKEGVKITMDIFLAVLIDGSYSAATKALQDLKDTDQWNPESDTVSKAAEIACIKHKRDLFELLIQKEVTFSIKNLPGVVSWGSNEYFTKVIEHLRERNKWDPKSDIASETLEISYIREKNDISGQLLQEEVTLTMSNLPGILRSGSRDSIIKAILHLKDTGKWDVKVFCLSETLKILLSQNKYDVYDILIQERVSIEMGDLEYVINNGSNDFVVKAIKHFKDTGRWDVAVYCLSQTVINLLRLRKYDICDILIQQGVLLEMYDLVKVLYFWSNDSVLRVIQHLKNTNNWKPDSWCASKALIEACKTQHYDVCDLLIHEGVSLSMKDLFHIIQGSEKSVESAKRAIWYLKNSNNWDPKFEGMSTELENAYRYGKYGLCNLLIKEGVSLSMKNLPGVISSVVSVSKAIKHLRSTNSWVSDSSYAFAALQTACVNHMCDVANLLMQEGVSFTMKNILDVVLKTSTAPEEHLKETEFITQTIKHLKATDTWDASSQFLTQALEEAFRLQKYAVFDLLLQERISPTMKILSGAVNRESTEFVTKLVQLMKEANTWDPTSDLASDALELALRKQNYDVCNLLIREKVLLTMKILPGVVCCGSIVPISKVIKMLKDASLWDPSSPYASEALEITFRGGMYIDGKPKCDVSDLLIQEGVAPEMEDFGTYSGSCQFFTKVIYHLKDKNNWDPHHKSASVALQRAYVNKMYDVCDLLIKEGISLTMENLSPLINDHKPSLKSVSKVVQHLKDQGSWNPDCEIAKSALKEAFVKEKYDVCDLLIQEGISPTMEHLLLLTTVSSPSLQSVSKVVHHLKDKGNWNPHCEDASVVLQQAYGKNKYDICDLLIEEGIFPTMKNLMHIINDCWPSMQSVSNIVQHLKDKGNWDPHCEYASVALQQAYEREKHDVCDLLIQEGLSPTMKDLLDVVCVFWPSLKSVFKVVQHLKDTNNWSAQSEYASDALVWLFFGEKSGLCDLLIKEGVSLTMKNLYELMCKCFVSIGSGLSHPSQKHVSKVVHHLKEKGNWNPHCESASAALREAHMRGMRDVCDLLIQEGISPKMK